MPVETQEQLPLLLFPRAVPIEREVGQSSPPRTHLPGSGRQRERLEPRFRALQRAFDEKRLELQANALNDDPDLVVVFETVGSVDDIIAAATRIPGLEWLAGTIAADIEPDEDFYDTKDPEKRLGGKLFLVGSNRSALDEVVRLWRLYEEDRTRRLGNKLEAWKTLFQHLKDVRFWSPQDRLGDELRDSWQFRLNSGATSLRFEIEAWHFASNQKNTAASAEIRALVDALRGQVLDEASIDDIAYHGFLVELPVDGIRQLLDCGNAPLLLSERVMFLRPQGQAMSGPIDAQHRIAARPVPDMRVSGSPVVAMLDGLPVANHPRLAGRVIVDDPDDWGAEYPAGQRVHGTAMASLIAWGELDADEPSLTTPIYVRPIMRLDLTRQLPVECTPDDKLLLDLVHVAVRRVVEQHPTVRIINLSVADAERPFAGELSPWARLIDWLQYKHRILFIVSAGNHGDEISLAVDRAALPTTAADVRSALAMRALCGDDMHRRLLAPAESVNALTVGASHSDRSTFNEVPGRYALFPEQGVAPYSRVGPGFRRAVKPDILLPGGRVLFRERVQSPPGETRVHGLWDATQAPGHLVAAPPTAAGDTVYTRGTSNSAALGSRWGAHAHSVLETLRAGNEGAIERHYDAVMIKALLAHGTSLGDIEHQVGTARPDVVHWHAKRRLVSRYAGLGVADVGRALTCTLERATVLGTGALGNEKAVEFRVPIPVAFNASLVKRRLTVTLAWFTPINPRHSKYRAARMWADVPDLPLGMTRSEGEKGQLRLGTLHHEVFESQAATPVVAGQVLIVRVNCVADAGRLWGPVEFALCVTLEAAEGSRLPIYEQVRERLGQRVGIAPTA